MELDFTNPIETINFHRFPIDELTIVLPLPSIGQSNSYITLAEDFLEASYCAEILGATCEHIKMTLCPVEKYQLQVRLILKNVTSQIIGTIEEVRLVYDIDLQDANIEAASLLRDRIYEYEEKIDTLNLQIPELADDYNVHKLSAYYEYDDEVLNYELSRWPERKVGFFRSAISNRVGKNCYTNPDSWLVPADINLDEFFFASNQNLSAKDFIPANMFIVSNSCYLFTDQILSHFPFRHFFKSLLCESFILSPDSELERFDINTSLFTHLPYEEYVREYIANEFPSISHHLRPEKLLEKFFLHKSGEVAFINDGTCLHIFYDVNSLSYKKTKEIVSLLGKVQVGILEICGGLEEVNCDWPQLNDELFEQLCYDIVTSNPKFDPRTIKKMGLSRSRDGGRDIEVLTVARAGEKPRRWIFQCKYTLRPSLTASKLQDVGDMLEQYNAEGFGVMTNALIDSGLYDKIERICVNRRIQQHHYSRMELERELLVNPDIKKRFFSK